VARGLGGDVDDGDVADLLLLVPAHDRWHPTPPEHDKGNA